MAEAGSSDPLSPCSSPSSELTVRATEARPMPVSNERLDWRLDFSQLLPIDTPRPTSFKRKLETGVNNGDCLPGCFAAMLECFHRGHIASDTLKPAAKHMRESVCEWIKQHWETYPIFNDSMKVHEIIRLLHDYSIPEEERALRGEWGDDPAVQLVKYNDLCGRMYFSDAEMLMFSCMMWERRRLPVMFRVFRVEHDPLDPAVWKGTYQTTTPEPEVFRAITKSDDALVIDVAHVGVLDGWGAHYKLLIHGSVDGLTQCLCQQQPAQKSPASEPTPRRRLRRNSSEEDSHDTNAPKRQRAEENAIHAQGS